MDDDLCIDLESPEHAFEMHGDAALMPFVILLTKEVLALREKVNRAPPPPPLSENK